jgi:hypothetical protein
MPVSLLVRIFFWLWFGAAIAAGHFLVLQRMPPIAAQGFIIAISMLLFVAYSRVTAIRTWADTLDLRALVLLHVTRFIGIYLLALFQRGELPGAFALSAGITDVIVATMALPIALAPVDEDLRRRAIVIWNVVGFVGILVSTLSAARLNFAQPAELRAFRHLPLSLLPTLLTPLLLVTHLIIFARTARPRAA